MADDTNKDLGELQPEDVNPQPPTYVVGTGGGPGMMSAANSGAKKGLGRSLGFGISLPFESSLNPFVDGVFTQWFFLSRYELPLAF